MIDSIKVFNGEKIKRGPIWYIIFITFVIFLIVYSFFQGGLMGGISVLFLFLVVIVSYIILYLMSMKKTEIKLYDGFLMIGDKKYNFQDLMGFNIEIDKDGNFTTFILVPNNSQYPLRYTLISGFDEIKGFYKNLIELGLPLYAEYENDRMYKLIRFLKLG